VGYMAAAIEMQAYLLAQRLGPLKSFREYQIPKAGVRGGGSFFSGYSQFEHMNANETPLLTDPFCLGGLRKCGVRPEDKDKTEAEKDTMFPNIWVATGFTGHPGVRVVRRTTELFEQGPPEDSMPYGEEVLITSCDCTFSEGQAKLNAKMAKPPDDIRKIILNAQAMEDGLMKGQGGIPGQGAPRETRVLCSSEAFSVAQAVNGNWAYCHFSGPEGYEFSALASVAGALALAEEDSLIKPDLRGGVVTPAYAFHRSTFVERLSKYSWACGPGPKIKYEVKDGPLPEKVFEAALKAADTESKAFQGRLLKGELATSELPELVTQAKLKKERTK